MDKREEIAKELILMCQGVRIQEKGEIGIGWLEKADKISSIANRIPCPECKGSGCNLVLQPELNLCFTATPIAPCKNCEQRSRCPSCKDGWLYPDVGKMYETLKEIVIEIEKWNDKTNIPYIKQLAKEAIKGE